MIKGYVKGARNVNRKCESESLFGEFIAWNVSENCDLVFRVRHLLPISPNLVECAALAGEDVLGSLAPDERLRLGGPIFIQLMRSTNFANVGHNRWVL
jgi:hypothetical protein